MKLIAITAIPLGKEDAGARTRESFKMALQYSQGPFSEFAWAHAAGEEGDGKSLCDLWNEARDEALKAGADWFMVLPAGALVDVECFERIDKRALKAHACLHGEAWTTGGAASGENLLSCAFFVSGWHLRKHQFRNDLGDYSLELPGDDLRATLPFRLAIEKRETPIGERG